MILGKATPRNLPMPPAGGAPGMGQPMGAMFAHPPHATPAMMAMSRHAVPGLPGPQLAAMAPMAGPAATMPGNMPLNPHLAHPVQGPGLQQGLSALGSLFAR